LLRGAVMVDNLGGPRRDEASMPPNKRLKLAGADRCNGSGVLCP